VLSTEARDRCWCFFMRTHHHRKLRFIERNLSVRHHPVYIVSVLARGGNQLAALGLAVNGVSEAMVKFASSS